VSINNSIWFSFGIGFISLSPSFDFRWGTIFWGHNHTPYGARSSYAAELGPSVDVGIRHCFEQRADIAGFSFQGVGYCANVHTVKVVAQ
jgi:hypothetical protein